MKRPNIRCSLYFFPKVEVNFYAMTQIKSS